MKIFTLSGWYIMTVIICYNMIPVLHHKQKDVEKKYAVI